MRGIATKLATWMAAWATTLCLDAAAAGGEVQVALERFGAAREPGEAEIRQLDLARPRYQEVAGRDVAVDDPLAPDGGDLSVRVGQRLQRLACDEQGRRQRQGLERE